MNRQKSKSINKSIKYHETLVTLVMVYQVSVSWYILKVSHPTLPLPLSSGWHEPPSAEADYSSVKCAFQHNQRLPNLLRGSYKPVWVTDSILYNSPYSTR